MNGNQRMERNQKRQQTGIKVRSTKQKSENVFFVKDVEYTEGFHDECELVIGSSLICMSINECGCECTYPSYPSTHAVIGFLFLTKECK
jgi:hypothetical protein